MGVGGAHMGVGSLTLNSVGIAWARARPPRPESADIRSSVARQLPPAMRRPIGIGGTRFGQVLRRALGRHGHGAGGAGRNRRGRLGSLGDGSGPESRGHGEDSRGADEPAAPGAVRPAGPWRRSATSSAVPCLRTPGGTCYAGIRTLVLKPEQSLYQLAPIRFGLAERPSAASSSHCPTS
jgi:hypothetical protein